ncbi:Atxe2 family lasso peptide isopeptidase [Sphingomonas oryzagri]
MVGPLILGLAAAAVTAPPPVSIPDIIEVTDMSGLSLSPDGRLVVFRTERPSIAGNDYRLRWYVAPVDGSSTPRPIGDGGDAQYTDAGGVAWQTPVWAPSGKAVYYRALIDGAVQIWRAPVDGGSPAAVTHDAANIRSLELAPDGKGLRYEVGARRSDVETEERSEEDQGVFVDGHVDVALPLVRGSFVDGRPATERFTGQWFARAPLLFDQPVRSLSFTLPAIDSEGAPPPAPLPVAFTMPIVNGRRQLLSTPVGSTPLACPSTRCRDDRIRSAVALGSDSIVVTTEDRIDRQTLSVWTPAMGRWREIAHGEGLLNGDRIDDTQPCAVGAPAIICIAAEPAGPPRLVSIDPATGMMRTLFDPNQSLRERATAVRPLTWQGSHGLSFGGFLVLPRTPAPREGYPLVINYYDCWGFLRGGTGDEQPMMPLAEAGIASLCIQEPHLTPPHNQRPDEIAAAIDGVSSAVTMLADQHLVDRSRVGMMGLSFGSEMTMAVAQHTALLRAAAIASGQMEPTYWWANDLPGRDFETVMRDTFHVGSPDNDPTGWDRFAPVRHVAAIRTPMLMQMPENEMRLAMELYSRLANSPTPTEMYGFPGETHVKHQPRHKLAAYTRAYDWFRFWLLGVEDPDPAKQAQYRRWRRYSDRPGFAVPRQD